VKITVAVDALMKPLVKPEVVLDISSALYDQRTVSMTSADGKTFEATLVPVLSPADLKFVTSEAEFTNGILRCQFPKVVIRADQTELQCTEIRSIEQKSGEYVITKNDQSTVTSKTLAGLPKSIPLGAMQLDVDLLSAKRIVFSSGTRSSLEVTIRVLDGGQPVVSKSVTVPVKGRAADDLLPPRKPPVSESPDEFAKLGESRTLPDYLFTADAVNRTENGGVRLSGINRRNNEPAGVIQTRARHYLEKDFVFDVLLEFEHGDRIAYIGIGAGKADESYNGLTDSVYLRFHAPDVGGAQVDIQNWNAGHTGLPGKVPNWGVNRVRIIKEGSAISFHVDPQNDGPTDDDLELTIPDLREFSPYLNSKNSNLFLSGSATFLATRLQESP